MRRLVKRFHPPGTSPGTLAPPVGPAEPVLLSLTVYDGDTLEERAVTTLGGLREALPRGKRAWLRIIGHDAGVMSQLISELGVHPLVVEDILNVGQRPKVEDHEHYVFIVLDVPTLVDGAVEAPQVSLLLLENLLVTVEERASDLFALVEQRLRLGQGKIRRKGVDYLAYTLVDAGVDHFFPVLDALGEAIEEVEDALLEGSDGTVLWRIHELKRDILQLRKGAWPLREAAGALARLESPLVDQENRIWLRDVYDHTVQVIDIVESFRDMLASLVDLHLSSASNRMNAIMKVLTIIATIFIPLTFIAGVYGMNFANMPELRWRWGYPGVLVLMAVLAGSMVLSFKRRRWL